MTCIPHQLLQRNCNCFSKGLLKALLDNVKYKVPGSELKSFKLYLNAKGSLLSKKSRNSHGSLIKQAKKTPQKAKLDLCL